MNQILQCNWDTTSYFIISDNVFDPVIYYSHLAPMLISAILALLIFYTYRNHLVGKLFILLNTFFVLWSFFDLLLWATERFDLIMFFWSMLVYLDLLIYASAFYMIYVFAHKKDLPLKSKALLAATFIPLILFAHTNFNLGYFDYTNCDREAGEGLLWRYVYLVEIFIVSWLVIAGIGAIRDPENAKRRGEIVLMSTGVVLFLIAFSLGNIAGSFTENWEIGQYGLFGMPVFAAFMSYVIVRYHLFNTKLLAAQTLVTAMLVLISSQLLFVQSYVNTILIVITFLTSGIFGYLLIRSVKHEVARKEELVRLARELEVANVELKRLDRAKSEFISIASHQLRTPLTAIKGYISLILEGTYGKVPEKILGVTKKVYQVNEQISQLVEDLLNISRIESGRLEYDYQKTDLVEVVDELYDMFSHRAHDKELDFEVQKFTDQLWVKADRTKMREVISNLLDNALKYTDKGFVKISLFHKKGMAHVRVSDSGIGIPEEIMPQLFHKFSRGKDQSRLRAQGTGLGLYVGKIIVEKHEGRIHTSSAGRDQGSEFTIVIPLWDEQ